MAIANEGTFDYVFHIDSGLEKHGEVVGRLRDPVNGRRLVGHAPRLASVEYQLEAWQLYTRITLTPSDRQALVGRASFSLDRRMIRMLREGDSVYVSRTAWGGLGLSVIRRGDLIGAAGAITHVPLGTGGSARLPLDLIAQAERLFRTRDAEYDMGDYPVELTLAGETRILHRGRPTMGPFDVFIRHAYEPGLPGTNECISIERRGVCSDTAAHRSAQLLDEHGLEMRDG
jgi:hypothetical protein